MLLLNDWNTYYKRYNYTHEFSLPKTEDKMSALQYRFNFSMRFLTFFTELKTLCYSIFTDKEMTLS